MTRKPGFIGQRQQLLERVESIATALGLGARPIHPRLDAVESERLDCRQSRRQASRSAAGFLETIGAREVPPPYQTPTGTKGAGGPSRRADSRRQQQEREGSAECKSHSGILRAQQEVQRDRARSK